METIIKLKNASKIYSGTGYETRALDGVDLEINRGELVAIMGPSGSGKSTMLNIIGCMDELTGGEYYLDGNAVHKIGINSIYKLRKKYIGFVFQHFALMEQYTAYENIELPLLAANVPRKRRKELIHEQLEQLGIAELAGKRPGKMSGGQQQRVAIARALVTGCDIILADEPTGALDQATGSEVMELLKKINKQGKTVIIVTHDENIAKQTDRIINVCDGKVCSDKGR